MEFCRKRTNGERKAGDRKVGRKGEKKALSGRRGVWGGNLYGFAPSEAAGLKYENG